MQCSMPLLHYECSRYDLTWRETCNVPEKKVCPGAGAFQHMDSSPIVEPRRAQPLPWRGHIPGLLPCLDQSERIADTLSAVFVHSSGLSASAQHGQVPCSAPHSLSKDVQSHEKFQCRFSSETLCLAPRTLKSGSTAALFPSTVPLVRVPVPGRASALQPCHPPPPHAPDCLQPVSNLPSAPKKVQFCFAVSFWFPASEQLCLTTQQPSTPSDSGPAI